MPMPKWPLIEREASPTLEKPKRVRNAGWKPGDRYGKLTVMEGLNSGVGGVLWEMRCDCGTIKWMRGSDVRRNKMTSCGAAGCKTKRTKKADSV